MNKFSLIALAFLATSALAATNPTATITYEEFSLPDQDQVLLTGSTTLDKFVIGILDTNDIYFQLVGYDHSQTVSITAHQLTATQKAPQIIIPTINTADLQTLTGKSFIITAKTHHKGTGDASLDGDGTYCANGKFKAYFNTLVIKCTHTAFTDSNVENESKDWKAQIAANKKWFVAQGTIANDPTYFDTAVLAADSAIGAAETSFTNPKFFSADTNAQAQLLINPTDANPLVLKFKFTKSTAKNHYLITIGKTSEDNFDTLHCYKERHVWFVANTIMSKDAETKIQKYQVATVALKRIDVSGADVIVEFTKTFADSSTTNSAVTSGNADRAVIMYAKAGSLIASDTEFIKQEYSLSLTAANEQSQVGVTVPAVAADHLGVVSISDNSKDFKFRYQFYNNKAVGTKDTYNHLLVTLEVPEGYDTESWIGFGIKKGDKTDVRMASGLNSATRTFSTFNDGILDSYPSDFSANEASSVDGTIVGSKVTDTTMEVTFLIPVNADTTNDADLSTVHSASNSFYIFGKKVATAEKATSGVGKISQATKTSFTKILASSMDYKQTNTVAHTYSKTQTIGTANAKIGPTASTMTFNGLFTYVKDNAEVTTYSDGVGIVFALTFKDTASDLSGKLGLSFGLAQGKDAHYFDIASKTLKDANVKTAVTQTDNAFTDGALEDDAASGANDLVVKGYSIEKTGTENTIFILYQRNTKISSGSSDDQQFAIDANDVKITDVFAFQTSDLATLNGNGKLTTPSEVNFKINTTPATELTAPSNKVINNIEGVTLSYKIVKSTSDNTALTKISELESEGSVEVYVNLLDGSSAFDKYTIIALKGANDNEYEGIQIENPSGPVTKVKVTTSTSGDTITVTKVESSSTDSFVITNPTPVFDTKNKLVKLYATKTAFGYDSSAKELKQFNGIVVTTEVQTGFQTADTKVKAFTHTASLSSGGLIAKATLMMIAILFLYFC